MDRALHFWIPNLCYSSWLPLYFKESEITIVCNSQGRFSTKRGLIVKCGNEYTGERKARRCSRWKITGAQRWGSVRLAPGKCRHQEGSVEWWRASASCGKKSLRSGWLGTIRNSYIILLKHRSPNQSHCAKLNVPEEPGLPEAFMVSKGASFPASASGWQVLAFLQNSFSASLQSLFHQFSSSLSQIWVLVNALGPLR